MKDDYTLLIDCCIDGGFVLNLNETAEKGLTRFRGKFQEANQVNKNKRMYPFGVLDENVKKLADSIKSRGLVGELDHPTDSIIHLEKASHVITKLWWDGNSLMGEGEILNTSYGRQLRALLDGGVRVGISSRGVGNGRTDENGILVIGESYKLITFDAVADPSTSGAFQEKVVTGPKRETYVPQFSDISSSKNEASRIHTINKDVLVAYLRGSIKEQTSNIKARLG